MSFLKNLEWRRAEKGFAQPTPLTPIPDIQPILNAIVAAPTSFGLQPFVVKVVTETAVKAALAPVAYNQPPLGANGPQITQCTHLLVFCARTDLDDRIDEYVGSAGVSKIYEEMMRNTIRHTSHQTHWAKHQAYIALGYALAAATELKLASCPMEGFSPDGVSAVLNLPYNLVPTALLAIGIQDTTLSQAPRFRFPEANVIQWNTDTPTIVKPIVSKYRRATPVRRRKGPQTALEKIEHAAGQ